MMAQRNEETTQSGSYLFTAPSEQEELHGGCVGTPTSFPMSSTCPKVENSTVVDEAGSNLFDSPVLSSPAYGRQPETVSTPHLTQSEFYYYGNEFLNTLTTWYPIMASKITGMLLDLPREEILLMFHDKRHLLHMAEDCVIVLKEHGLWIEKDPTDSLDKSSGEQMCPTTTIFGEIPSAEVLKADLESLPISTPRKSKWKPLGSWKNVYADIPLNVARKPTGPALWTRPSPRSCWLPYCRSELEDAWIENKVRQTPTVAELGKEIMDCPLNTGLILSSKPRQYTFEESQDFGYYSCEAVPTASLSKYTLKDIDVVLPSGEHWRPFRTGIGMDRLMRLLNAFCEAKEEAELQRFAPVMDKKQEKKKKTLYFDWTEQPLAESGSDAPTPFRVFEDVEDMEWDNYDLLVHNIPEEEPGFWFVDVWDDEEEENVGVVPEEFNDWPSDYESDSESVKAWEEMMQEEFHLQDEEAAGEDVLEQNGRGSQLQVRQDRDGNYIIQDLDQSEVVSIPATFEVWTKISLNYFQESQFFTNFFRQYEDRYGRDYMMEQINEYLMTSQFKRGTLDYYHGQLFQTRKRRDDFIAHMDNRRPRAEAEMENDVQVEENVIFTDQREIERDQAYITNQIETNHEHIAMDEEEWHVRNLMRKPEMVAQFTWSTSDGDDKQLLRRTVPGGLLGEIHKRMLSNFMFFRGHPKIRIQINSTKFHFGRLLVAFVPMQSKTNLVDQLYIEGNLLSCPHIILDAGESNSGILDLPFVHPQSYFNVSDGLARGFKQYLGELVIVVFNKLGVTTTASKTVDVTIWISYENCELHQPCYYHSTSGLIAEAGVEGLAKAALPMLAKTVGNVLGMTSNCDKPTDPNEITRWVPNAVSSLNFGDGLDKSNRLSLCTGTATIGSADMISTTKDDTNLLEIAKIPTRLNRVTWSTGSPPGTNIWYGVCCPTLCWKFFSKDRNVADLYEATLLGYIARAFKYWRGSLKYKIQVVASPMQTGRLMITYTPGTSYLSYEASRQGNVYTLDLQERKEIEIVVPYMNVRPWLRCDYLVDPGRTTSLNFMWEIMSGVVEIFIQNRLTSPDESAQSIQVNILISAGDDFELAFPADLVYYAGSGKVIVNAEDKKPEAESLVGAEAVSGRTDSGSIILSKGGRLVAPVAKTTMSENAMDLKTVLRRYYKVYENVMDNIEYCAYFCFPNSPTLSSISKNFGSDKGFQNRTHLSHFAELFTFWRGSLRYKLILDHSLAASYEIKVFHVPGVFQNGEFFYTSAASADQRRQMSGLECQGTMIGLNHIQGSLEFEIPFYTPYDELLTVPSPDGYDVMSSTGLVVVVINQPFDTTSLRLELYQSAGDDFAFNLLRAAPRMQFDIDREYNRNIGKKEGWLWNVRTNAPEDEKPVAEMFVGAKNFITAPLRVFQRIDRVTTQTENTLHAVEDVCSTVTSTLRSTGLVNEGESDGGGDEDDNLNLMLSLLKDALKDLAAPLQQVGSISSFIVSVSNLVSGFNSFIQSTSLFVRACSIVTIVSELLGSFINVVKSKLHNVAMAVLKAINVYKQGNQYTLGEADFLDFAPALLATFGVGAVAVGWKSIPDDKQTNDLIKNLNDRLRLFNGTSLAMSNIKGLWNNLKEIVEGIIEWILLQTAPQVLAQMKLQRGFNDIENFARWVQVIHSTNYVDRSLWDAEFRNELLRWAEYGEKLQGMLLDGKIKREAVIVRDLINKILEMRTRVEKRHFACPFRVDPFCVCLFGEPGIGKSACVTKLAFDIMDEMEYPKHNRWCSINPCEQFFTENYDNQTAVYIDDFGAFDKKEQYENFFNLKSNTLHTLNMASLEKKGTYFKSDFIFMTTNIPYPSPNCMHKVEALWRRRDCLIECAFKPDAPHDPTDRSNLRYRFMKPRENNKEETEWMDYESLYRMVVARAKIWMASQRHYVQQSLKTAGYEVPEGLDLLPPSRYECNIPKEDQLSVLEGDERFDINLIYFDDDVSCDDAPIGEAKIEPHLDINRAEHDRFWCMYYYNDWLQHMVWVDDESDKHGGHYSLDMMAPEEIKELYRDDYKSIRLRGFNFQDELWRITTRSVSSMDKVREGLATFKNYISAKWEEWKTTYPWLSVLETWPVKLAGAMLVLSGIVYAGAKVVHKCICVSARYFGWRCFKCGKWPELEKCENKEWMLAEWRSVYGPTVEYENGRILSVEEEQSHAEIHQIILPNKPHYGTKEKFGESGPYANIVRGSSRPQVFAQGSPYNNHVKGAVRQPIFAEISSQKTQDLIFDRLIPYTYRVKIISKTKVPMSLNAIAIGQRKLLIPAHFFTSQSDSFEILYHDNWMKVMVEESRMTKFPNKDLIIYDMPVQFHQHRSMINHFISEKELSNLKKTSGYLIRRGSTTGSIIIQLPKIEAQREFVVYTDPFEPSLDHSVQNSWKYPAESSPGSCGSPLVSSNSKLAGQILGVHVCGNGSYGWSTLITKEMLKPLITAEIGTPLPKIENPNPQIIPKGHFASVGQVSQQQAAFPSSKSQIIPTKIQNLIRQTVSGPSVLRNDDPRLDVRMNVAKKAFEKYGQIPIQFDPLDVEHVFESLEAELEMWDLQRNPKVLSLEEAVLGIPELEGYDRLPMNTSPGWPYTTTRPGGTIGKSYLFEEDTGKIIDSELETAYYSRKALAQRGERCVSVWTCCLKDERRPLEKVRTGSTRMFSIPPVDLSLITRQYTLDFSVAIKDNRHTSFTKVGIDPQSMEWTELYYYLAEFSSYVIAGDFSRFDGTLPPDLSFKFYEHCDNFYKKHGEWCEEDRRVRMTLADEAVHTVHILNKDIIVNHTGNESGDPNTVNKNSFVNYYYMALSWLALARRMCPDKATMSDFRKNVRLAIYGDDNLLAVKPEVLDWYNQETISEFLKDYGIVYTNEEKTGITKFKQLKEASFLKSTFHDHEGIKGIKVPRMSEKTIYELLNWTRIAPDQDELLESNCNDSLRFAYFYGQEYFENLRKEIIRSLKSVNLKLDIMTYTDFHYWFLFVIGRVPGRSVAECILETVSKNGNGAFAKLINKTIFGLPYKILSKLRCLQKETSVERTDSRYAIAIPSGEGKSWLTTKYPNIFVDHDELLLPAARQILKEEGLNLRALQKIFDKEKPIDDRRVLLCHHPDNTKRKMLGCYVLPKPSWIRANVIQRLRMKDPVKLEREVRNQEILRKVKLVEPQLF